MHVLIACVCEYILNDEMLSSSSSWARIITEYLFRKPSHLRPSSRGAKGITLSSVVIVLVVVVAASYASFGIMVS
jgi:hypothetical protein